MDPRAESGVVHEARSESLRPETRWPLFGRRAADLGVRSMPSFQLYVQKENLGALNLYGRRPDAFGDGDEDIGLLFAGHAAVALVGAQHQHHSDLVLTGRDIIGQAKGILMERYKIGADQARSAGPRLTGQQPQTERHRPRAGRHRQTPPDLRTSPKGPRPAGWAAHQAGSLLRTTLLPPPPVIAAVVVELDHHVGRPSLRDRLCTGHR